MGVYNIYFDKVVPTPGARRVAESREAAARRGRAGARRHAAARRNKAAAKVLPVEQDRQDPVLDHILEEAAKVLALLEESLMHGGDLQDPLLQEGLKEDGVLQDAFLVFAVLSDDEEE